MPVCLSACLLVHESVKIISLTSAEIYIAYLRLQRSVQCLLLSHKFGDVTVTFSLSVFGHSFSSSTTVCLALTLTLTSYIQVIRKIHLPPKAEMRAKRKLNPHSASVQTNELRVRATCSHPTALGLICNSPFGLERIYRQNES